jgi:hypothetical protein
MFFFGIALILASKKSEFFANKVTKLSYRLERRRFTGLVSWVSDFVSLSGVSSSAKQSWSFPEFLSQTYAREKMILKNHNNIIIIFSMLYPGIVQKSDNFEFLAMQKFINLVGTFGFVFFSPRGLPRASNRPPNQKMPFPYWKIYHFIKDTPSISAFHWRFSQNHPKSAWDG